MSTSSILDIVQRAIAESGADGLSNNYQECGCRKDDLAPCDNFRSDCVLAKSWPLPPGNDWDFLMVPLDQVERYDREQSESGDKP